MKKQAFRAFITILASILLGYGIRICLDILAARTGWHVGGEALVLATIPAAIWLGWYTGYHAAPGIEARKTLKESSWHPICRRSWPGR